MNASTEEQPSSSLDTLKWGVIFILLAAAVAGNYVYGEQSVLIRAVAVVVMVGVAGLIALQTEKGRNAAMFAKEARTEVRKVVWPTRQEAVQTTGIVLVVTLLMSLLLWGLDSVLFWLVGLVTGMQV
ncbi:MAG: preprotein translocase subunit SecE [Alteromonadales bacterium]|nr:preprotein translocase subunit SecE [Alteromonadales bacterium]MCP4989257.1 preprotein translocase subunit SecE [Colwellia sp.]